MSNDDGDKYLKLYGVLQAVFLQQDSIRKLYEIFLNVDFSPEPSSAWARIRNLRNLSTGHPIKSKGDKYCQIARITLGKNGFKILVWDKKERQNVSEDIDLHELLQSYKEEIAFHLETIHKAQIQKWGMPQE